MPKPTALIETAVITEAAAKAAKETGRMPVQLISPGWGSSGYYSADVLAEAATNVVIPAGTHMYADHPTEKEAKERPGRSIKDLMSVTAENARVATDADITQWGADPGALVAEVDVVPGWQPLVEHLKGTIGVSVRGAGEVIEGGTAEGRTGRIVESFEHCASVDWVTHAGRGGRALSLMESAQAIPRAIAHGLSEATARDTEEVLRGALRDAYGADRVGQTAATYVWVRDFDPDTSTVWFEIDGPGDDSGLYAQQYAQSTNGAVELSGDRTEVRVKTTYVPATRPDSSTPTTEDDQEVTMGKISIEESEHTTLTEKAGRVDALQEENTTLKARIGQLEKTAAKRTREDRAAEIIIAEADDAGVGFTPRECKGLLADIALTESGDFDEAAFTTLVKEEAAAKKAGAGAGTVLGHGSAPIQESGDFWGDIDKHLDLPKED